jgi:hypothetical protein
MRLGAGITWVALAGTVGALGMLGHRRDGMIAAFVAGGHLLLPQLASSAAAAIGLMIHGLWIAAWSILFAAFMQRDRRSHAAIPAAVIALVAFAVSLLLPQAIVGPLATLSTAERGLVHVVLAVSLALGMRLAPRGDGAR